MNIRNVMLVVGLAVVVGCASETKVFTENMDADARRAVEAAVRHAGFEMSDVRIKKVELDRELLSSKYEVEFEKGWYEYEYDIDAGSGKILKAKKEFDW